MGGKISFLGRCGRGVTEVAGVFVKHDWKMHGQENWGSGRISRDGAVSGEGRRGRIFVTD